MERLNTSRYGITSFIVIKGIQDTWNAIMLENQNTTQISYGGV
jgi:hypothetical protein